MKLAYARRALEDMAEIDAHIRAQDPETAKNVAREIQARCAALALNPFLNPTTDMRNVRRMPLTRYPFTVYYRTNTPRRQIFILRIVRSSRVRTLGRVPR